MPCKELEHVCMLITILKLHSIAGSQNFYNTIIVRFQEKILSEISTYVHIRGTSINDVTQIWRLLSLLCHSKMAVLLQHHKSKKTESIFV